VSGSIGKAAVVVACMGILPITGRSRIATISMCCRRHPSVIDAAKNCDAVDETDGRGRGLLAAPSSPAKELPWGALANVSYRGFAELAAFAVQ
jgi:hypothetical protein